MIKVRRGNERGHFNHGWLETFHSFSFGEYHDKAHTHFRALRVINEDFVQPGGGFPTHPHSNMEIITVVLEGALQHQDSMGNGTAIRPGEVQRMTAGSGVTHSEFNPSPDEPLHLLQIWIFPEAKDLPPGYEQKMFSPEEKSGKLRLVASRDGRDGSVTIHQDAELYSSLLAPGQSVSHALRAGRSAWLQVVRGTLTLNGVELQAGDGAAIENEPSLELTAAWPAEILLFDLA